MLKLAHVSAAIAELDSKNLAVIQARAGISLERTLVEIAKGAFFDVRNMFNADGSPKGIHELDDITAAAIEGIDVVEQYAGSGDERVFVGVIKKYKLAKRSTSLDMLMKHLNGYKAENDSKGAATASALLTLLGDMRRSSLPIVEQVDNDHGV
jgi:phage terminase small subunit